ncbi:MAG: YciI family protein, partial [Actinomycetes bacterium]
MKQYLLSVYQPEGEPPPPAELEEIMRNVDALQEEMKTAGAWVFSGGLEAPSTATVLELRDGQILTTDGPFAEAKE